MYNFKYVTKKEYLPVKNELIDIVHLVQKDVREYFTFQYEFIGSSKLNMITCDFSQNLGYDFDVNLYINDENENFTAKEIRNILRQSLDNITRKYGYDYCEDSTRVLTIKCKDRKYYRVIHSCDFAIINVYDNGKHQYIRYNKRQGTYTWEYTKSGFELQEKINWLKRQHLWQITREYYIDKKNYNTDHEKHSCSLRAEAITEMCQKYGYYD